MAFGFRSLVVLGTLAGGQATTRRGGCRSHVRSLLQLSASDSQARAPSALPQTLAAAARLCPAPHSGNEPARGILRVGSAEPAPAPLPRQGPRRRRPETRSFTLIRPLLASLRWEPRTPPASAPHGGSPRGQGPAEATRRPRRGQESGRPG